MALNKKNQRDKPTVVLLIRHGQNDWVGKNKLAGWTPGVRLNKLGRAQAAATGQRLASEDIAAVYSSPLERTVETAQAIAQPHKLKVQFQKMLGEVDYGQWTGKSIAKLSKTDAWPVVQFYPSAARFPGGESLFEMQARAVQEINRLVEAHPGQTIVIVSHADLIKSVIAHYLGTHLDLFQRIVVSPASITRVAFLKMGPRIITVNDTGHLHELENERMKKSRKRKK
ncbi:MAG: MSMEG_4193 family putative phosphomutase [Anaerolineae bacterium]